MKKCCGITLKEEPCKNYVVSGSGQKFCTRHGGIPPKRAILKINKKGKKVWHKQYEVCRCKAYKFPHHIGQGLCKPVTKADSSQGDLPPIDRPLRKGGLWD